MEHGPTANKGPHAARSQDSTSTWDNATNTAPFLRFLVDHVSMEMKQKSWPKISQHEPKQGQQFTY